MPYHPGVAIFRSQVVLRDVEKALVAEFGNDFEFSSEGVSEFGMARDSCQLVFYGPLPSGDLDIKAWVPIGQDTSVIGDELKAEWRALILRLHKVLIRDTGALLSYTSANDDRYSGFPAMDEIGALVSHQLKESSAAALRYISQNPFFFWVLGINRSALGSELHDFYPELTEHFHVVEESTKLLQFENKKDTPLFLKREFV